MPPIVSIVGNSNSGKTTLIEKLIPELKKRGYRVATIKHTSHDKTFDEPDKDTWRHIRAGSEATVIRSREEMVLFKPVSSGVKLDGIVRFFGEDYDIILAEGFKQDSAPKIEVHRKESGPLLAGIEGIIAIATDEALETETRVLGLDDVKALADLLEEAIIKPQYDRLSLYINNNLVALSPFPREIISNILMAIAASLKGVGQMEKLEVYLKKNNK